MRSIVVAVALLGACRGDSRRDHEPAGSAAAAPLVPHIFSSDDGVAALVNVDRKIEILRTREDPGQLIGLLLVRATYRGRVEDYVEAEQRSAAWVASAPGLAEAWEARTRALTAIHEVARAREALVQVKKLVRDDGEWLALEVAIDEMGGPRGRSMPARMEGARRFPNAMSLALYAATLAFQGQLDAALDEMALAAAKLRDNSAETMAWLYFQWGRLYEQKGDYASARAFYQEAHARLPGYVEANVHLAQTMIRTGDLPGAKRVVGEALAGDRHPALLELAAQLGIGSLADARGAWERYVTALPAAFADHAARFYLGAGADPRRAVALARDNLANRDVPEARELLVEAALAVGDTPGACEAAGPLADARLRAHRFAAWQAFSRCGRTADATRLAADLGIAP